MDGREPMNYEPGYAYVDYFGVVFRVRYSDGRAEILALPPAERGNEGWWRARLGEMIDLALRNGYSSGSWFGADLARAFVAVFGGEILYSSPTPEQEEWAREMAAMGAVF
jgi:hypothetical protein